jgi:branched-chain amino acid transport system permease protein
MGAGAFTTALITTRLGWPFWVSWPMAGVVSALIALILSYPLLRLKGMYFVMGSFAAGEVLRLLWVRFAFFGRHEGIYHVPRPSLLGVNFNDLTAYYFLTLVLTLLCLTIIYRLEKSGIGVAIKSVAAQDFLAQSVGVNIRKYKTFAFVTGSFFSGIAGALLAHRLASVSSLQFAFSYNINVIVWVLFGGLATFVGPLIGLVLLTIVAEVVRLIGALEAWLPFIYGLLIIAMLIMIPGGLSSILPKICMPWAIRRRHSY